MGLLDNFLGKNKEEKKESTQKTAWIPLNDINQLATIEEASATQQVMVFKHSTRCNISVTVLNKFEKMVDNTTALYYLDLLNYRDISSSIAEKYGVTHQSPQLLVFKDGQVIKHGSHYEILDLLP